MSANLDALGLIELTPTDHDEVKIDLEVTCSRCTGVICDVEAGDTLSSLVRTTLDHLDSCEGFPCAHCGREIFFVAAEGWVCPEAGTDREFGDGIWRETCPDNEDPFSAHAPEA